MILVLPVIWVHHYHARQKPDTWRKRRENYTVALSQARPQAPKHAEVVARDLCAAVPVAPLTIAMIAECPDREERTEQTKD